MITIKDIAKKADVSIATVSLALNNSNKIKPETAQKVKSIARKLNYTPNLRGRALVKGLNFSVGLVVPEIMNYFFSEIVHEVKKIMYQKDYYVILCSTDYQAEEERRYFNLFQKGIIDGAILAGFADPEQSNNEYINQLKESIPVVCLARGFLKDEAIPEINAQLQQAIYKATEYLIELGHTNIAFAGKSYLRLAGYKQALEDYGFPVKEEYILDDHFTMEEAVDVVEDLLELPELPSALVCFNDNMAMGVIQSLANHGVEVPTDMSIIGCDNIKISQFINPPLTTVDLSVKEMAAKAASLLLKKMNNDKIKPAEKSIVFPAELVIRDSTIAFKKS